jgi:hypothetical protein
LFPPVPEGLNWSTIQVVVWAWLEALNATNTNKTKAFIKTRVRLARFASLTLSFKIISSISHKGGGKIAGLYQAERSLPAIKNLRSA